MPHFFPELDGRRYALDEPVEISREDVDALRRCAADVAHVLSRIAPLLRAMDDDGLRAMGYPEETLPLLRLSPPGVPELRLARVDAIRTPSGFRAIECNADTPALLVESFAANGAACAAAGLRDPNAGEAAMLRAALLGAIRAEMPRRLRFPGAAPHVVFTADDRFVEDRETMRYACALAGDVAPARYVPLCALGITERGLCDERGRRIDVLVRLWPIELFARDRDVRTGAPLGPRLFALIASGRLGIVNPPSGFLLQNKSVFALVYALADRERYFTEDERAMISRSFARTTYEPEDGPWVRKPAFGREAIGVVFGDGITGGEAHDADEACVYQSRLDPPLLARAIDGVGGAFACVHSCFLLDGRPSAVGLRIGAGYVGANAYFVPLGCAFDEDAPRHGNDGLPRVSFST